jgi:predicted GNAT superfamily acetyltransferase
MIEVRPLSTLSEFSEALKLQQCIWGYSDSELLPLPVFVVTNKIGGQVLGAFVADQMVGFCLAIPGIKLDGHTFLHSHMLGVLAPHRNAGVGRELKLAQRSDALARGINLIEWTFDPLELKNAYFNIERLGAVVRRYVENQYGASSSPLQGPLPTDRCVAEWWIASPRVERILKRAQKDGADSPALAPPVGPAPYVIQERISVPAEIGRLKHDTPERARQVQHANAARFQDCFDKGLAVIGFERGGEEAVYLLGDLPPSEIERDQLRERIRQIEVKALRRLQRGGPKRA